MYGKGGIAAELMEMDQDKLPIFEPLLPMSASHAIEGQSAYNIRMLYDFETKGI